MLALLSESLFFVVANADNVGFLLGRFFVEVLLIGCKIGVVRTGFFQHGAERLACARTFWKELEFD